MECFLSIWNVFVFSLSVTLIIPLSLPPTLLSSFPRWVRGEHFKYRFTLPGSGPQGKWWVRKRIGAYFPAVDLVALRGYFKSRNWPHPDLWPTVWPITLMYSMSDECLRHQGIAPPYNLGSNMLWKQTSWHENPDIGVLNFFLSIVLFLYVACLQHVMLPSALKNDQSFPWIGICHSATIGELRGWRTVHVGLTSQDRHSTHIVSFENKRSILEQS